MNPAAPVEFPLLLRIPGWAKQATVTVNGAPVELLAKGRLIQEWKLANNSAGPLPKSPVTSRERLETITLIPYGSAKLRITTFPQLAD